MILYQLNGHERNKEKNVCKNAQNMGLGNPSLTNVQFYAKCDKLNRTSLELNPTKIRVYIFQQKSLL